MEKKQHHFELRLSRSESRMLHANARAAGMYCSDYLRTLIKGFVPKPTPRAEFYLILQRLTDLAIRKSVRLGGNYRNCL